MSGMRRVEIRAQKRLLDDFFKIDEVVVAHQRYDGTMSSGDRRLVFERGDSVAMLLFDKATHTVVLVEQFKLPVLIGRRRGDPATMDGWITELPAGMVDEGETAEQAAVRETFEETGYRIHDPQLLGKFFSSAGGASERVSVYFAHVSEAQREEKGGGIAGEEDIKVFRLGVDDLFARLAQGAMDDPRLVIAAYWLKDNIERL